MEKFNLSKIEINNLLIESLHIIDSVSKDTGYTYYLHAGTVLGCIRHKDLIPWDDDIDVIIPITYYYAFIDELKKRDLGKFRLLFKEKDSTKMQAKIVLKGQDEFLFCIDLFPLIGTGKTYKKQLKLCKKASRIRKLYEVRNSDYTYTSSKFKRIIKFIIIKFLCIFSIEFFYRKFNKILFKYDFNLSEYVTNPCGKYGMKNVIPRKWYGIPSKGYIKNEVFPIPEYYMEYLKHYYGDFTKLPSESEQYEMINKKREFIGNKEDYDRCIHQ